MNTEILSDLVALGEGFTTEFKRAGTSGLGREICAFANATGGTILIGVSDAGDVIGVPDHNRLKSEVQSTARSADPPIAVDVGSAWNCRRTLCVRHWSTLSSIATIVPPPTCRCMSITTGRRSSLPEGFLQG